MKSEQPQLVTDGMAIVKAGLIHRVWEPDGNGPHPTIIMNHGRSGTEDVTWVFAQTLPKEWLIVSPRALYSDDRGGYSWDIRPEGEWPPIDAFTPAVDRLYQFVHALPELYNADLSRLYMLGFSQGAAVSYTYTMRYPNSVKGIAGLVGLMAADVLTDPDLANLRDLPVMMMVGRKDDTIPQTVAHDCAMALIHAGVRLDYREYNTGHKLNAQGMRDLKQWWATVTQS
jgi:phospholipase/carboxylesterase